MKWDMDKAIGQLEDTLLKGHTPGTGVNRVFAEAAYAYKNGIKPRKEDGQSLVLWCLSFGWAMEPKSLFYGRTIRAAYLRARKILLKKPVRRKPSGSSRKRASS